MIELLHILTNREAFYRFRPFIKDHVLPKESKLIINGMDEYYSNNPTLTDIDIDTFETWFLVLKHSTLKPDVVTIYQEVFKNVKSYTGGTATQEEIIETFIQRDYATRLADTAMRIAEGESGVVLTECQDILDNYTTESKRATTDDGFVEDDIHELIKSAGAGLDWRLNALNKSLGPLRKGDLIIIGKLPETGGTAFAVSECTHMLAQLQPEQNVLYFGNEETGFALKRRFISSLINRNWKYVEANPVKCADEYKKLGGDRILIKPCHGKSLRQLENIIKRNNAGLIVFDQLWKMPSHGKATSDVQRITDLFVKAREMAANYAPVLAIHQADGTAFESMYIGMEQLYMSRIGIQGEADAIVTIGISKDAGNENTRYINIPKNKLPGGHLSEERFRHGKFEVQILKETSRFKD